MSHFQGFRPGDLVDGRYQIVEEIGRGGFGVVYKARQMAIDRVVALKILLPEADTVDPQAVERFRREAVLISSLESPNTITLIEFGQTDQGALYTVMEYARGDTLGDILHRERKLDAKRSVRIASQVLLSLHEAHQRGIIHRDLKPANIMVGEFAGQSDHVKVLDFGIAKILKSGDTQSTLALTGRIVGTPRYMSPEQLRGANPTPGSDLYAMGLIMYEMLAGGPAIRVTDAMAQVEAQMKKDCFRLPQLPGVPLNLVTSINRAMEKDPSKRYQSAQAFRDDLETAISGRPLSADPNKTKVRTAIDGPIQFQSRGGPPTAEYDDDEGGGGFGAFLVAAVVLFMLALGGAAFLLLSDNGGGSGSEGGSNSGDATSTEQGQEQEQGQQGQGAEGGQEGVDGTTGTEGEEAPTRRPLPTPRNTEGAGTPEGGTPGGSAEAAPGETGTPTEAPGAPTEAAGTPTEAAGTPTEAAGTPTEAAGTPTEAAGTPTEAAGTPTEAAGTPTEAAGTPTEAPAAVGSVAIEINADPDDASVYINDDRICRSTPCTVEVPDDGSSVNLRVSESGYHSARRSISASDGPSVSVNLRRRQEEREEEEAPSGGGLVPL